MSTEDTDPREVHLDLAADVDARSHPRRDADVTPAPTTKSGLFGRGMLYVVISSLQLVAATVVSPILAHILGPSEFGLVSSAIALHQVLAVFAMLGIDQALAIQRGEDGHSRNARGLAAVGMIFSAVAALVAGATLPLWQDLFGFGDHTSLVIVVILWTAPAGAVQVMIMLLLAEDRLRAFSVVSILAAVGTLVIGLTLVLLVRADAVAYAWGAVIAEVIAAVIGLFVARPSFRGIANWSVTRRAMKLGLPLVVGSFSYFVLNAGDRFVIQNLLGASEVGRYQVAYVVGSTVILLLSFTSSAWTPRFAALPTDVERRALAADSRDELYRLLLPITLGITLAAPAVLRVVAPASFEPEGLLIVVFLIALSAYPVAASGATGRILVVLRRGKTIGALAVVAAALNIGLNIVLIPVMGIAGAALATLLSFVVLAGLQVLALPRPPGWVGPPLRLVLASVLVCTIAGATVFLPQTFEWNAVRFVVAVACLPWLFIRLKQARSSAVVPAAAAE